MTIHIVYINKMSLSFLSACSTSVISIFKNVISDIITNSSSLIDTLTPSQIEKIKITIKYLANHSELDASAALSELECPEPEKAAELIKVYSQALKTNQPFHQLKDFDWSASIILGTSEISNIKETICTFKFDVNENEGNGKITTKSHYLELTIEEAEELLEQLKAARATQTSLIQ